MPQTEPITSSAKFLAKVAPGTMKTAGKVPEESPEDLSVRLLRNMLPGQPMMAAGAQPGFGLIQPIRDGNNFTKTLNWARRG